MVTSEGRWATVRRYADAAEKFQRGAVACMVMAGFELLELHKSLRMSQGKRTDLPAMGNFRHSDGSCDQLSWEEQVTQFGGVSEPTSRRWMAMAEAAKPRLKKLAGAEALRALLEQPASAWTAEQSELIKAATHKLTDGESMRQLMFDWGIAKLPQGAGATGGARAHPAKPTSTMAEQEAILRQLALDDWRRINQSLDAYRSAFILLDDSIVQAQCAAFETALHARRKWLAAPRAKRNPRDIAKVFDS